ncbi:MAG: DUF4079 domain-containing protein [Gloeomargaritaceae cyanobacterium C42_A2020_066]|nr:DUF4079 domain-containing protein [Gloeomargaritaceae cyanobacterium C42_A2020_066]
MDLKALLQPAADFFKTLNTPEPIVHWGHPVMMGIVIFVMGTFIGVAGWQSRLLRGKDEETAAKKAADHRKLAPLLYVFLASGYTGGLLSLVMQDQPILESPHFWTGSLVLLGLTGNALLSLGGFWGDKVATRTLHAYLGSATLVLAVVHAFLGVQLGLSF